ncbi:MAG: hypothetical protein R3B57_08910 [Phycisphaerales bacterium]
MKSAIAVAAVAGLATVASAQTGTVTLTAGGMTGSISAASGDMITINVYAASDSGPGVFSFDIQVTSGDGGFSVSGGPTVGGAYVFGWAGSALANGATGLGGSTDIFGPTFDAPLDGLLLYSFQVTYNGGTVTFNSSDGAGPNPALQTVTEGGIVLLPAQFASIVHDSLTITPAPSGIALLGLGGLVATRRRR